MEHLNFTKIVEYKASDFLEKISSLPKMDNIKFPDGVGEEDQIKCIVKKEGEVIYFTFAYFDNRTGEEKSKDELVYELWKISVVNAFYEYLHKVLSGIAAAEKKSLSPLFGPGYYNMPMTETSAILRKANADRIGVSINDYFAMVPPFTRCGLFVLCDELAESNVNQCRFCNGDKGSCSLCNLFNSK